MNSSSNDDRFYRPAGAPIKPSAIPSTLNDIVLRLREARRRRGLKQRDVARLSGFGEKTISSFETGERISTMKLSQLHQLLLVYGVTEAEFFGAELE